MHITCCFLFTQLAGFLPTMPFPLHPPSPPAYTTTTLPQTSPLDTCIKRKGKEGGRRLLPGPPSSFLIHAHLPFWLDDWNQDHSFTAHTHTSLAHKILPMAVSIARVTVLPSREPGAGGALAPALLFLLPCQELSSPHLHGLGGGELQMAFFAFVAMHAAARIFKRLLLLPS